MEHSDFPHRQMLFPMDSSAPDYAESVQRVVGKLSDLMGMPADVILAQTRWLKDDVLQFRVVSDHYCGSSIPLDFTGALVNGIQQLLKSAACTVIKPRIHHPKITLNESVRLIDKTRFEQTGRGSFIIKVSCPINAIESQDSPDPSFIGTVEQLNGEIGEDGRRSGEVVLSLLLPEGDTVRARLALNADDYAKADQAHMRDDVYTKVSGRLRPGRQPQRMTDLSHFDLVLPP
ncbi:MAG: hypothetical protein HQL60_02400 [Magnetococcales bacterium]|nr:hypothetical protein [Magnetococcales bacterium]